MTHANPEFTGSAFAVDQAKVVRIKEQKTAAILLEPKYAAAVIYVMDAAMARQTAAALLNIADELDAEDD